MSELSVQKVTKRDERSLPIFREIESVLDRIRARAFDLAAGRGFLAGRDLDDWLEAERAECWPSCELSEHDGRLRLSVALPGYNATEIGVTATPDEIIVKAVRAANAGDQPGKAKTEVACVHWSEFRPNDVYRRVELPAPIDVAKCAARLEKGILVIEAPRVSAAAQAVTVAVTSSARAA
jgi:HSP20 family molecular chaperone IbpA